MRCARRPVFASGRTRRPSLIQKYAPELLSRFSLTRRRHANGSNSFSSCSSSFARLWPWEFSCWTWSWTILRARRVSSSALPTFWHRSCLSVLASLALVARYLGGWGRVLGVSLFTAVFMSIKSRKLDLVPDSFTFRVLAGRGDGRCLATFIKDRGVVHYCEVVPRREAVELLSQRDLRRGLTVGQILEILAGRR